MHAKTEGKKRSGREENTQNILLQNFRRGEEGRKWIIHPDETTSQKEHKQQIDGRNDGEREKETEGERGAREPDNWQRVKAACTARQAAQLELKAALRRNEDVVANQHMGGGGAKQVGLAH